MKEIHCREAADTIKAGFDLGKIIEPGTVICLYGPLGSGKTTFTKGLARALDVNEDVTSPTFTIVQQYAGAVPFYHIDLYRIRGNIELEELGLEDIFWSNSISVVEWPERLGDLVPEKSLHVSFSVETDQTRILRIRDDAFKGAVP